MRLQVQDSTSTQSAEDPESVATFDVSPEEKLLRQSYCGERRSEIRALDPCGQLKAGCRRRQIPNMYTDIMGQQQHDLGTKKHAGEKSQKAKVVDKSAIIRARQCGYAESPVELALRFAVTSVLPFLIIKHVVRV